MKGQNNTASTTRITRASTMSSGGYSFNASGTINFQYYRFDYLGGTLGNNGLLLNASATITSLDDGYFDNFASTTATDTFITVATGLIGTNTPSKTIYRITFMNTATTAEYNVSASGATTTGYWLFTDATGTFAGETHDYDVSAEPGEIQWLNALLISGIVYADEGFSTSTATATVTLIINSTAISSTTDNLSSGAYSLSGYPLAGDTIIVFLDNATSMKGVLVSRATSSNMSGMDIYQNRIIVRSEDGNPVSLTELDKYDSQQDPDILYLASTTAGTLTATTTSEFYVWPGKTFNNWSTSTVATTTLTDLEIRGTFNASNTQNILISGNYPLLDPSMHGNGILNRKWKIRENVSEKYLVE